MSSEWKTTSLGFLTDWMSGGTPKKDEPKYWSGDIPWISANSMHGSRYSDSDLKLTQEGLKNGSRLAPSGSVLLLVRGGALHSRIPVGMAIRDVAFNQDVKALVPKTNELRSWYLLYWLMGMEQYLLSSVVEYTGIGAGKLDTKRMQGLDFLLPPVSEQDAIIGVIKSLDDRITLLRETNATLEAIAQSLFKSWFVDFDPVRAKMEGRAPEGMDEATAALFPDSFEESELGLVPSGWGTVRLDSFIELAYGKALKAENRKQGMVPVYGSGGITGWHDQPLVESGSIIIGRKGTVGSIYWESQPFFPIDTVFYVKSKKPLTYCYQLLKTLGLESMNTDAAVPGLNRENVYRLLILGPQESIVEEFDRIASALRAAMDENERQAQTLSTLRDTLLPRLISGQLRLSDNGGSDPV